MAGKVVSWVPEVRPAEEGVTTILIRGCPPSLPGNMNEEFATLGAKHAP